jgi:two-component system, OmpR family, response regulator
MYRVPGVPRSARGEEPVRLLVVEDEERLVAALRRGLTQEGFAVDVARDGLHALDLAECGEYDAIVLDIMLPRLSGYEVARRLRARGDWTPVLMLSAKDGEYDQADGLDLGADDYLTKPFSFVVLLARLRALVRRGRRPRPSQLSAGRVLLDPASREVFVDGAAVELTVREFALLEYLLARPGETVSKIELLDHVWEVGGDGDPNVVQVYIGYLRRKLGDGIIETVRGAGYRIRA